MKPRFVVVLAAGKGSRMKSLDISKSKLVYEILGKPILCYALFKAESINPTEKVIILGFGKEGLKKLVPSDWKIGYQDEIIGTGDALKKAAPFLEGKEGSTLVLYADMPTLEVETLERMFKKHEKFNNDLTFLTSYVNDSIGRNRLIREEKTDKVLEIKETKETIQTEYIFEVDSGAYIFDNKALFKIIKNLKPDCAFGEYSLISMVKMFAKANKKIGTFVSTNHEECISINNRVNIDTATRILKQRVNNKLMEEGVTLIDSDSTYICPDVKIGPDTVIHPGTVISGNTTIGANTGIGPNCLIHNCTIGNDATIIMSHVRNTIIPDGTTIEALSKVEAGEVLSGKVIGKIKAR